MKISMAKRLAKLGLPIKEKIVLFVLKKGKWAKLPSNLVFKSLEDRKNEAFGKTGWIGSYGNQTFDIYETGFDRILHFKNGESLKLETEPKTRHYLKIKCTPFLFLEPEKGFGGVTAFRN